MPIEADRFATSSAPVSLPTKPELSEATYTQLHTLELFNQGLKPADIAELRNVRLNTVTGHLAELLEMGYAVEIDQLVVSDRRDNILAAIAEVGADSLTQIRDYLGDVYGYDVIRLVRSWWRRQATV